MFTLIDRGNIADQKSPGYCRAEWRTFRSSQFGVFAVTQGLRFGFREFSERAAVTVTFVNDVVDDCGHLFKVPPAINRTVAEDNSVYGEQYCAIHCQTHGKHGERSRKKMKSPSACDGIINTSSRPADALRHAALDLPLDIARGSYFTPLLRCRNLRQGTAAGACRI